MEIQIDMYQTLALSVVVLMLGQFLKQKINFLEKFCIPSPVVGGLIFSVLTCILYSTGVVEFTFDDTLREVCMVFFFTSVGFTKPVTLNPYLMESSRIECPPTKAHLASTNLLFPPSIILPKIFKSSFSGKHTIFKAVFTSPPIA